jgi:hypothetical protein
MPGQLKFQGAGVLRLMDHALAATTHKGDYVTAYGRFGERWLKSEVTKEEYEAWYKTLPAGMQLVKDEGAYLMSNGLPGLPVGSNAVYAERLSNQDFQNNFDATYDRLREICGGDDFVETLPMSAFQTLLDRRTEADKLTVVIALTEKNVSVSIRETIQVVLKPPRRKAATNKAR